MKRVENSDIKFILDSSIINVENFKMKFYTVNADNYYIQKTNSDVVEESGETSADTVYSVALNWNDLLTIGEGVLQFTCTNNYQDNEFADNWYNYNVQRTTQYFINSNVFVEGCCEKKSIAELVSELTTGLTEETNERILADSELEDKIDNIVISGGVTSGQVQVMIDASLDNYYTKAEVDAMIAAINDRIDRLHPSGETSSAFTITDVKPTAENIGELVDVTASKPTTGQLIDKSDLSRVTLFYLVYPLEWEVLTDGVITKPYVEDNSNHFQMMFGYDEETPVINYQNRDYRVCNIQLGRGTYTITF